MQWFKVQYDLDQRQRVYQIFKQFKRAVKDDVGIEALFQALVAKDGVPSFFEQMFEVRGNGGSFYGRSWKPLSSAWLRTKAQKQWDERIGHRLKHLRESLTIPGSKYNISRVFKHRVVFGSRVVDTVKGSRGKRYAGYFNTVRPLIDEQTMVDLKDYLLHGQGTGAFSKAVLSYKQSVLKKAVAGQRRNRFGNVFPQ